MERRPRTRRMPSESRKGFKFASWIISLFIWVFLIVDTAFIYLSASRDNFVYTRPKTKCCKCLASVMRVQYPQRSEAFLRFFVLSFCSLHDNFDDSSLGDVEINSIPRKSWRIPWKWLKSLYHNTMHWVQSVSRWGWLSSLLREMLLRVIQQRHYGGTSHVYHFRNVIFGFQNGWPLIGATQKGWTVEPQGNMVLAVTSKFKPREATSPGLLFIGT